MHRFIINVPKGKCVDHINNNKLDNRKSNLRICTDAENSRNKGKQRLKHSTSKFKGVSYKTGHGWYPVLWINNKAISRGHYDTEIEAAFVYNQLAIEYHGEFAKLNKFTSEELKDLNNIGEIKNRGEKKRKVSKYKNVTFNLKKQRWVWVKMINGKLYSEQRFKTEDEAYEALQEFLKSYSKA